MAQHDSESTQFEPEQLAIPSHADALLDYGAVTPQASQGKPRLNRRQTITVSEIAYPSHRSTWTIEQSEETMDDASIIINVLADLAPAGVLPLSYGMVSTGFIPSVFLLVIFGMAAAYMMYLVGRTIEISGHKSYAQIWKAVVGPSTSWVPSFVVLVVCFGCCLAYACMFGDLFAGCMPGFGFRFASRSICLTLLGFFPLWPLSCMKDLSALAPTSFGAIVAVVFTLIMMVIRSADGTYAEGGKYFVEVADVHGHMLTFGPKSLVLVNSLAVAYLCHYNGCKYYREYIGHRPDRFGKKIATGFSIVTTFFAIAMLFGFLTHASKSNSVILNNYHKDDLLANIARMAMGLANVLSFPLMFSGLREQTIELICFFIPALKQTTEYNWFQNALSTGLVVFIILIAIAVTDASIVIGLVGALCGSATIYVLPCFLFDRSCASFPAICTPQERTLVRIIGCVGVALMFAGTVVTLSF